MKQLTCEMCGSTDLLKQDGVFVCQTCGCKYSVEEAKKMMVEGTVEVAGTVKVDNSGLIDSYLQMAESALNASNNAEAENYANKIIEIEPHAYKAWFIKGKAAGWQTTGRNNRYPESIVGWSSAYEFAPEEERKALSEQIREEAVNMSVAILTMHSNSFAGYRSKENAQDVLNAMSMIQNQLGELKKKTSIDVYTSDFKTLLARAANKGVISALNNARKDFGPENRNRDKFNWELYTKALDSCLTILDKSYDLCSDDNLNFTICKNYIIIAEEVCNSCSYKFQPNAYTDGTYIKDYSFTATAIKSRTETIDKWKKKRDLHDPEVRKSNIEKARSIFDASRGEAEEELARTQYWEAHAEEKAALESENERLDAQKAELQSEFSANPDLAEVQKMDGKIAQLRSQMAGLGLFKGKEKKEIQAQIDDLSAQKNSLDSRVNDARIAMEEKIYNIDGRKKEISDEFTKSRGSVKVAPVRSLSLFEGEECKVSALDLVEYHRAVVSGKYGVKGSGEEAVENYTRTLILQARVMMATLSVLRGNTKAADDLDMSYQDNPQEFKQYRINFTVDGKDSEISVDFTGKTTDSPVKRPYYYCLNNHDGVKSPEAVADFIHVVFPSVIGICPDVDLSALEKMIVEAAYGLTPKSETEANGIVCMVTGSTKGQLRLELQPKTAE